MNRALILMVVSISLLVNGCGEYETDTIAIRAHRISDYCDEFNHLWEVDSVSHKDYEYLIGEILYSKLASEVLADNRGNNGRNEILFAEGRISKGPILEHYTCSNTWFLLTEKCRIEE